MRPRTWVALGTLLVASSLWGQYQRGDLPEFESDYRIPTTDHPLPEPGRLKGFGLSPDTFAVVDVGLLAAALVAATWIALRLRSRPAMVVLTIVCLAYFGFWRGGCVCPIGSIQHVARAVAGPRDVVKASPVEGTCRFRLAPGASVDVDTVVCVVEEEKTTREMRANVKGTLASLESADGAPVSKGARLFRVAPTADGYAVGWTVVAFFALPLLFALLFGRVFCAGVCPLGAMQDLVLIRPLTLPRWLARALGTLPWVYLGLAVLFAATNAVFIICRYDPFVPFFRLAGPMTMFIAGAAVLVLSTFVGRPYCRFLCPYGALLGGLSRVSWKSVTVTPDDCVVCGLCEDTCPFGAILPAAARKEAEV
ncbi:MAG TPA: 4Fe-4S binding protein [Planctomycetota bacterium]|nr:4Fe-4S binding protein [Planctomycetota bacterium]